MGETGGKHRGTACAKPLKYEITGRMGLEQGDILVKQNRGISEILALLSLCSYHGPNVMTDSDPCPYTSSALSLDDSQNMLPNQEVN